MKIPNYFGGMILSDIGIAYDYEYWLASVLKYRFEKYRQNRGFLVGMESLMVKRKYSSNDFHHVPDDPLIHIPDDILYWKCLSLKRRKLNILKFEVFKYYRRHRMYPL